MNLAPDLAGFKRLARKGNLIAVSASIPADLETPVSAFLKLAASAPHAFLLESAEQNETIGRYSFIGLEPAEIVTSEKYRGQDILSVLENKLSRFKLANPESLPNFCGGFIGYLSYENVQRFENIRLKEKPGIDFPEAIFFLSQELLIFDHFRKMLSFVILVNGGKDAAYQSAKRKIDAYIQKLKRPLRVSAAKKSSKELKFQSNTKHGDFLKKVRKIKEYVRAGDCIQVVLSQRFKFPKIEDDFRIYRALRSINPSPYMFYFRSGKNRLIGSSPELLVKKEKQRVEVRPIAGTRPRGGTTAEDLAHEESLKKSPKEMAEHLMLVDLGRNDLGRVCKFDTIRVGNFARVERYSHVMHLVSDVTGTLKSGQSSFDLLRATFPAGTVSGAPKIRAMQIINELEPEKRGPYAGCLGYFSFNHDMDMCITIRTMILDGKNIYLQAGAGIVKDSQPESEYQETMNKARALFKALAKAGDF